MLNRTSANTNAKPQSVLPPYHTKEVEFDAPEKPNVISAPMPKHGHNVHAIVEDLHVTTVDELMTLLPMIKMNLLKAGIFQGCEKDCYLCLNIRVDCPLLKSGI